MQQGERAMKEFVSDIHAALWLCAFFAFCFVGLPAIMSAIN